MSKTRTAIATLVVSAAALVGIAGYEDYRGSAYLDSLHVPTLGCRPSKGVKLGDTTTPTRALIRLQGDVSELCQAICALHQGAFSNAIRCLSELAFNIGAGAFCRSAALTSRPR